MILLLCSWFVLLSACLGISGWMGSRQGKPFSDLLPGLALLLLLAQVWAFFIPLKYLGPLILVPAIAGARETIALMKGRHTKPWQLILLLTACLLPGILPAWINDDPAYYLQSIKWYSEEGWYPGLAHLNVRLGLSSSWHALSAAFYWEGFSPDRVWNFNGLLLFLFCLELSERFPHRHVANWMPLLLGAPFLNAPSPDLPIALLGAHALLFYQEMDTRRWAFWSLLLVGLKATAISLIPLFLLGGLGKGWRKPALWIAPLLGITVWAAKNLVLTGYAFFPLSLGGIDSPEALPVQILTAFREGVLAEIYGVGFSMEEWKNAALSSTERITQLLELKPYKIIMTSLVALSAVWLCVYFGKKKRTLPMALVAGGFLLWLGSAPNYRFLLAYVMAAGALVPGYLPDKAWVRISTFVLPLVGMVIMNSLGIRQLRIIRCGETEEAGTAQVWRPVAYPVLPYTEQEESAAGKLVRPGDCLYCGDAPRPCYPDTVRSYNATLGYILDPGDLLLKKGETTRP